MIMNRTIMRMAAVCALNNFRTEPYPTLAGSHIFDSKIESVESTDEDQIYPMVVLYTDYDRDFWQLKSMASGKSRLVTLTLELIVAQIKKTDNPEEYNIRYPMVDSEIETALDALESQCFQAFQADNLGADCFRHLFTGFENIISRRGASVETGQRLAARQVTIEGKLDEDTLDGQVGATVQAFLTALQSNADYMERLPEIQQLLIKNASLTDQEQRLENFGYSNETGALLGYQRGTQPVLGTPVIYLDALNGNNPLD